MRHSDKGPIYIWVTSNGTIFQASHKKTSYTRFCKTREEAIGALLSGINAAMHKIKLSSEKGIWTARLNGSSMESDCQFTAIGKLAMMHQNILGISIVGKEH